MVIKEISEEQISEILNYLKNRQTLKAEKILKELPNKIVENENRLQELEEFAEEVKRRMRSAGRSMSIGVSDFEDLFIKHNINLGKKDENLK